MRGTSIRHLARGPNTSEVNGISADVSDIVVVVVVVVVVGTFEYAQKHLPRSDAIAKRPGTESVTGNGRVVGFSGEPIVGGVLAAGEVSTNVSRGQTVRYSAGTQQSVRVTHASMRPTTRWGGGGRGTNYYYFGELRDLSVPQTRVNAGPPGLE